MPKGNLSVARFYDWTEEYGDHSFSVSRLYREIANTPRVQQSQTSSNGTKCRITLGLGSIPGSSSSGANRLPFHTPGRMFVRDKKALTRGEREIIEGIYKNRSDLNSKDAVAKLDFEVRSHQEAWQTGKGGGLSKHERLDGKQMAKSQQSQHRPYLQCPECNSVRASTCNGQLTSSSETAGEDNQGSSVALLSSRQGSKPTTYRSQVESISPRARCSRCQQQLEQQRSCLVSPDLAKRAYLALNKDSYWDSRPCAPPCTPDKNQSTCARRSPSFDRLVSSKSANTSQTLGTTDPPSLSTSPENSCPSGDNSRRPRGQATAGDTNACRTPRLDASTSKIQKTIHVIHSVLEENSRLCHQNQKQTSCSSGFHSENPDSDCSNLDQTSNSSESETDSKKVKVRVYLPTAHSDYYANEEDQLSETGTCTGTASSIAGSICKERPLSHSEFRDKNLTTEVVT